MTARTRARAPIAAALVLLLSIVTSGSAVAQTPPPGVDFADADRAAKYYAQGLEHLKAERFEQALVALEASAKLFPSPNTHLLRGHALRSLGRRVDAMAAYERVVREAGASVRSGDERFQATLADAGRWVAVLRTEIGELAIEVRAPSDKLVLTIDGEPVATSYDKNAHVARVRLWHEPGRVKIEARGNTKITRSREVSVVPGGSHPVSLDLMPPRPTPLPLEPSHEPPLASWVAFGIGTAGFVVFAIAGGLATDKMAELDQCRPHCSTEDSDEAKTLGSVANIGLVVGVAGAITGGGVWLTNELTRPTRPTRGGLTGGVALSASSALLSLETGF
jgi:hypothetical protein